MGLARLASAFVVGGLFGLMAAWLRRKMQETPLFEKLQRDLAISRQTPLAVVIRDYRGQCLFALAMVFVFACMCGVYSSSYRSTSSARCISAAAPR